MKKTFLFVLLWSGQLAFAQPGRLVKVAGTKCSIIPPDGFSASKSFSGFQDSKSGASIMINDIPAPYQSVVAGFTADALNAKGMTLMDKQIIDFHGTRATFIKIAQSANGTNYLKQLLVFGDTKQTTLVNGIYPLTSKSIETKIKEALLSTIYNASQNDNPLEAAQFSIDVTNTEFKLIKYIAGALLYTADGKIPTDRPILSVGNSIAKALIQDRRKYAEDRLKNLPGGERSVIKEVNEITIDHLNGYEIIADGKTPDNTPELIYQVMLINNEGSYYIIVGQTREDFRKYLEIYRKISKTFKQK